MLPAISFVITFVITFYVGGHYVCLHGELFLQRPEGGKLNLAVLNL